MTLVSGLRGIWGIDEMMILRVLMLLPLLLISPAFAQQQPADEENVAQENAEQQEAEQATAETDAVMPDLDNQPIERVEGQAPGRFIPSEQISQDLGVSFPTDI